MGRGEQRKAPKPPPQPKKQRRKAQRDDNCSDEPRPLYGLEKGVFTSFCDEKLVTPDEQKQVERNELLLKSQKKRKTGRRHSTSPIAFDHRVPSAEKLITSDEQRRIEEAANAPPKVQKKRKTGRRRTASPQDSLDSEVFSFQVLQTDDLKEHRNRNNNRQKATPMDILSMNIYSIEVHDEELSASEDKENDKKRKSGRHKTASPNSSKNVKNTDANDDWALFRLKNERKNGRRRGVDTFSVSVGVQTESQHFTRQQYQDDPGRYRIISNHVYDISLLKYLDDDDIANLTNANSNGMSLDALDALCDSWIGQLPPSSPPTTKYVKKQKKKNKKETSDEKEEVWDLEYDPEIDGVPKLIITVGIPGSGKSTWANQQEGFKVVSSDSIRLEITGSVELSSVEDIVWRCVWDRLCTSLLLGDSVILDSTNTISKHRKQLLNTLPPCLPFVKAFLCSPVECHRRITSDAARGTTRPIVPYPAILKMHSQLNRDLHLLKSDGYAVVCEDVAQL